MVRIARASVEVVALQLDPLGAAGRRRLSKMTDAELAQAKARLEGTS